MGRVNELQREAYNLICEHFDDDPDSVIDLVASKLQLPQEFAVSLYEAYVEQEYLLNFSHEEGTYG
jgi:hypothetical protein|tara:strand:- start:355 stop:552 length:198 start_codon:yes stop_codon:yes gene_type:complete